MDSSVAVSMDIFPSPCVGVMAIRLIPEIWGKNPCLAAGRGCFMEKALHQQTFDASHASHDRVEILDGRTPKLVHDLTGFLDTPDLSVISGKKNVVHPRGVEPLTC